MPIPPRPLPNVEVVVQNDDNGSLYTGAVRLEVGDFVEISRQNKVLRVTYVMGSIRKGWRVCFRGQGAVPQGRVAWRLVETPASAAPGKGSRAQAGAVPTPLAAPELDLRRTPARGVAFIGFDSAWTAHKRGALCGVVVGPTGTRVLAPVSASFEEALAAIHQLGAGVDVCLVAIDQPLVVPNQTGRRFAEDVVSVPIGRRLGGVQPANRSRKGMFDDGAPLWAFLEQLAPELDPDLALTPRRGTFAIEVYPALANVALFQSPGKVEPLFKYNPDRPTFRLADWRALLAAMQGHFTRVGLGAFAQWCSDASGASSPTKLQQDGVDSLICLLTAMRWWEQGRAGCEIVGDLQRGYMVVPVDDALRAELTEAKARYA